MSLPQETLVSHNMRLFLAVIVLITPTSGETPAVHVSLTDKALHYGAYVGAQWMTDKLKDVSIPDISGEIYILFDNLHYTLMGITIENVEFPEPSVEFYPGRGLDTSVSDVSVTLTGGWITRFGLIQDGGTFQMIVFDTDVTFAVQLGRGVGGHPFVTSVNCEAHVGGVDMQFRGGASWIFQPFVSKYRDRVRGEIEDKICPQLKESIIMLDYRLQVFGVSIDVNKDLTLDLGLTDDPVIDVSSLNVGLKGVIYSIKTHAEPPSEPQPFSLAEQPDSMLTLGVSEFTLNSASYAYYSAGLLQILLNDSMIPSYSPVHLNTSSFGAFIPQLPKMYPGLLMNLQLYAREVPVVSFQPGLVTLDLQGAVKAYAIQPTGAQIPLFTLNTDSKFSGKVWTAGGRLKGSAEMKNLTVTLEATEIGGFETAALENLARVGAKLAITKLNQRLGKGVELPRLKHAELTNTTLEVEMGFITISTDAQISLTEDSTD
ncbi:bactericidal permeability-increasing protein [Takifugu rubripes]|uniref:Bactericidal permeability-increasing protein n=1 Tax=Takifugu rubripes TaxID=31033 RepID=H2SAC5_TAKRU|nr:bactericidal permeability-increasing protein [Takifugu rubripes]